MNSISTNGQSSQVEASARSPSCLSLVSHAASGEKVTLKVIECLTPNPTLIGGDSEGPGMLILNPEGGCLMNRGDSLLILAEDDSIKLVRPSEPVSIREDMLRLPGRSRGDVAVGSEKTLFCGWRRDIGDMILLLDEFVRRGVTTHPDSQGTLPCPCP